MPLPIRSYLSRVLRFRQDSAGSMSIEAALVLPLLCTFYVASFVYFDAFRAQNANLKAAYTIGDMISRETVPIDDTYLNALNNIFDFLTYSQAPTAIRITTVKCTKDCEDNALRELEMCWSWASSAKSPLNEGTFQNVAEAIPLMPIGDTIVLTETFMIYNPAFNVGIPATTFENIVVTRPRFAPQINYNTNSCYSSSS